MTREINLYPCESVYLITKYDYSTLIKYATLIIKDKNDDDYFYLYDDIEKIIDISIMPNYIKDDWIKYNKKEINISLLNSVIKDCNEKLEDNLFTEKEFYYKDTLELFKLLKRDLLLKGLL